MPAGRSSFTKRQKEQARAQKRQDKAEKKRQRSSEGKSGIGAHDDFQITEDGQLKFVAETSADDDTNNEQEPS